MVPSPRMMPIVTRSGAAATSPDVNDLFGVFGGLSTNTLNHVDLQSQTAFVIITSFAFLVPALTSWRMGRVWHAWLFAMMAVICASYHTCRPDASAAIGFGADHCHAGVTRLLDHAYHLWAYYCFLQMAFLVLGPEDPNLYRLDKVGDKNPACGSHKQDVPLDVVLIARVAPLVVLVVYHFLHFTVESTDMQWNSMLLNELLLLLVNVGFWISRRDRAPEVLLRFRYWHRLLHHGFIPAMMLFWIFCIIGFADYKALHSVWHVVIACFAVSIQRTVLLEPGSGGAISGGGSACSSSTYSSCGLAESSVQNPSVSHVLLGSVALIVLPTAVIGASFDWCGYSEWRWPTIAMAASCQPGGYFVAIAALPAYTAGAAVFWLIASTISAKAPSVNAEKPWEAGMWAMRSSLDPQQRQLGQRIACFQGYVGVTCGLLSALLMRGSAARDLLGLFCSVVSLGSLMVAMALCVLSSDPYTRDHRFRRNFTLGLCVPIMAFYGLMHLLDGLLPNQVAVPRAMYAITEYVTVVLVSTWPLIWSSELQEDGQRKAKGAFAWPVTRWRFHDLV